MARRTTSVDESDLGHDLDDGLHGGQCSPEGSQHITASHLATINQRVTIPEPLNKHAQGEEPNAASLQRIEENLAIEEFCSLFHDDAVPVLLIRFSVVALDHVDEGQRTGNELGGLTKLILLGFEIGLNLVGKEWHQGKYEWETCHKNKGELP